MLILLNDYAMGVNIDWTYWVFFTSETNTRIVIFAIGLMQKCLRIQENIFFFIHVYIYIYLIFLQYLLIYTNFSLQLQHNPWATTPQIPYSMQNSTCMASQSTVPNFMGLAHPSHLSSYPVGHQPSMSLPVSQSPPLDPCENSERRSTSIAALRLKAHEHGVAMGIFGAYGK